MDAHGLLTMGVGAAFCGLLVWAGISTRVGKPLIIAGLLTALVGYAGTTVGL